MKQSSCIFPAVFLLAACGGGDDGDSRVSSDPAPVASPAPVAAPTPAPVQAPPPFFAGIPVPAPAPAPSPTPAAPAPSAGGSTPTPSPTPAPITLGGLYVDKEMTCAQGNPMYWERKWTVGYNGGVTRFATGAIQYSASWESASLVTQQHQDAATFGAPTSDGQRTWLTVARSGDVIGAGFNGREDNSYVLCGNPYHDGQTR